MADKPSQDERISDLERQVKGWKKLAQGRAKLLAAYRLGTKAPENAFTMIEQARKLLGDDLDK